MTDSGTMDDRDGMISHDSCLYLRVLIDRTSHLFLTARQKELSPYSITPQQAYILFLLFNIGHKTSLVEMAMHSGREINTISAQMTNLEKDGLIKKTRVKPKSTLLCFELTDKGFDIYNKISKKEADKTIISVLSEKERQQAILMLKKIIAKTEKYIISKIEIPE